MGLYIRTLTVLYCIDWLIFLGGSSKVNKSQMEAIMKLATDTELSDSQLGSEIRSLLSTESKNSNTSWNLHSIWSCSSISTGHLWHIMPWKIYLQANNGTHFIILMILLPYIILILYVSMHLFYNKQDLTILELLMKY